MTPKPKAVELLGEIRKVSGPLVDGSYSVTLNVPADQAQQAAWLMVEAGETGVLFHCVIEKQNILQ